MKSVNKFQVISILKNDRTIVLMASKTKINAPIEFRQKPIITTNIITTTPKSYKMYIA